MIEVYTTMRFYYYNMTRECICSYIKRLQHKLPITSDSITFYEITEVGEFIEFIEITIKERAPANLLIKYNNYKEANKMDKLKKTIKGLECLAGMNAMKNNPCLNCGYQDCQTYAICIEEIATDALSLLKAQEPRILQIKEMAFLEIAVFIETNGYLEGKGTDLFLAIPYIYAVSQNILDGYITFVDGNTDVYDLRVIDYGKLWRCWTSRPTDEQRKAVKWK